MEKVQDEDAKLHLEVLQTDNLSILMLSEEYETLQKGGELGMEVPKDPPKSNKNSMRTGKEPEMQSIEAEYGSVECPDVEEEAELSAGSESPQI